MGCCPCCASKPEEPTKLPPKYYDKFNCPIPKEVQENDKKIYSVLEYWFCTPFTEFDKSNHVRPLDEE
jgi:hypothetical protein